MHKSSIKEKLRLKGFSHRSLILLLFVLTCSLLAVNSKSWNVSDKVNLAYNYGVALSSQEASESEASRYLDTCLNNQSIRV